MSEPLLDIQGLKTHFSTDDGMVQAVDGVDISVGRGETVGIVGESGCGKTVTAMSVLKLIAMPPGKIVAGFLFGSQRLYDFVDNNPIIELHPTDYVNDPFVVAQNNKQVAINSALEIDLTGHADLEHGDGAARTEAAVLPPAARFWPTVKPCTITGTT